MIDANGNFVYPWNHGETLTAAALNSAIASGMPASGGTVNGPATFTGGLNIKNLPTSPAGLNPGDVWSNGGVLCVA